MKSLLDTLSSDKMQISKNTLFSETPCIFFPTWKGVPVAYFDPFLEKIGTVEHPERVFSFKKEAERG